MCIIMVLASDVGTKTLSYNAFNIVEESNTFSSVFDHLNSRVEVFSVVEVVYSETTLTLTVRAVS